MFFAPMFLLLAFVSIAWLVAQWPEAASRATSSGAVLDPARRRLAAGEITQAEFVEIERTLGGTGGPARGGFVLLVVLFGAALLLASGVWMTAWTARGGDWDWGPGHMGRMMRWERSVAGTTLQTDAAEVGVQIRNFAYAPQTVSVRAGARVTWTNDDAVPHSATDRSRRWDTGTFGRGASKTIAFETPGTFTYYCTVHPSMAGTVIVQQ